MGDKFMFVQYNEKKPRDFNTTVLSAVIQLERLIPNTSDVAFIFEKICHVKGRLIRMTIFSLVPRFHKKTFNKNPSRMAQAQV